MLSVSQAIKQLTESAQVLVGAEVTEVIGARCRVLASDIRAAINVPPADNSAMDGYALRHADWPGCNATLTISQRITAGAVPQTLEPGTAARIFTGAQVPPGADTVVMQEHTTEVDGCVMIDPLPVIGSNIRRQGQDIRAGNVILRAGHRLRPQDLGLIASLGIGQASCYRPLKVAILSTGDELVEPGTEAGPARIYNSNRYTLTGMLAGWGYEVVDLGIVRDKPDEVRSMLLQAADKADVIVTTGGVSVGEEDHVKAIVDELGGIDLWKIAIKPGKPFAFGHVGETPFLGLPGNPVSVFVTLLIIARPFLLASQGACIRTLQPLRQRANFDKPNGPREDYLRVRCTDQGLVLYSSQSSGVMFSTSWGDGLVRLPPGQDICVGDLVEYYPWATYT